MNKDIKSIIKGSLILLSFFLYSILLYVPLDLMGLSYSNMGPLAYFLYLTAGDLIYLSIIVYFYKDTIINSFKEFKTKWENLLELGVKCWMVGLVIMTVSNLLINLISPNSIAANEEAVRFLIELAPIYMLFSAALFAPFIEELIFRKAIYDLIMVPFKKLEEKLNSKVTDNFKMWTYIIISALVFGGLHVIGKIDNMIDLLYIIPYGVLGGAFAFAYFKTKNIALTIGLHMIHNFIMVAFQIILLMLGE